jgi:chromosome segregation ATPase
MSSAVLAPGIETLKDEIAKLETEVANLTANRETEQKTLESLTGQRTQLNESIALGKSPASAAADLNRKVDGARATIEGLDSLLREPTKRLEEKWGALRRAEAESSKAAEVAEVVNLRKEAETILIRVSSVLEQTAGNDLRAYLAVRERLDRIVGRAKGNVFPIPAASQAAHESRKYLDKLVAERLKPVLALFGR